MTTKIKDVLDARADTYGDFSKLAGISYMLKCHVHENKKELTAVQKEALDMIMHKIARILNGNPNYLDNWVDIAGYAQLVITHIQNPK